MWLGQERDVVGRIEDPSERCEVARRPGGRTARVRRDVLDATLRHIADRGLDGLTIAAVASAAGVAQTTVYRRWPTPPSLVADALLQLANERNPMPDTGNIRGDLHQMADQIAALLSDPVIERLIGVAMALTADPDVAAARKIFWESRFELAKEVVERAVRSGQLNPDSAPREVIETLVAPLYFRLVVAGQTIDDDLIQRSVNNAIALHSATCRCRPDESHHQDAPG
jgi:AcrR family transcriptional regulator